MNEATVGSSSSIISELPGGIENAPEISHDDLA
jgi:hypothetical protein